MTVTESDPTTTAGSAPSSASRQDGFIDDRTRAGTARKIRKLASAPSHKAITVNSVVLA